MEKTQVVIIGGGATGAGLLWDLALRGISAVLLEKKDLANGATGRCHGLLHSGGRYVVKDAEAAKECISENMILKKVAAPCIHDTGGLFVHLPDDDPQYVAKWAKAARRSASRSKSCRAMKLCAGTQSARQRGEGVHDS